jgi:hypothetical protein
MKSLIRSGVFGGETEMREEEIEDVANRPEKLALANRAAGNG